jgi:hypothetical protein
MKLRMNERREIESKFEDEGQWRGRD